MEPQRFCRLLRQLGKWRCEQPQAHHSRDGRKTMRGRLPNTAQCQGDPLHICGYIIKTRDRKTYQLRYDRVANRWRYHLLRSWGRGTE